MLANRQREELGRSYAPIADWVPLDTGTADSFPFHEIRRIEGGPWPLGRTCTTTLRTGCYRLDFRTPGQKASLPFAAGTLRVETTETGMRFSGDVYRRYYTLRWPHRFERLGLNLGELLQPSDGVAATGDGSDEIPIFRRRSYEKYLLGTAADMTGWTGGLIEPLTARELAERLMTSRYEHLIGPKRGCPFVLTFDEYDYDHPASGYSGTFADTPSRSVTYRLSSVGDDHYDGTVVERNRFGQTRVVADVTMRWVSHHLRRASLSIHTLDGAATPPTADGGDSMQAAFAEAGWDLTIVDDGALSLPAALSGKDTSSPWSNAELSTLLESAPTYDPTRFDRDWRVHLVAVPGDIGQSRGRIFDIGSNGVGFDGLYRTGTASFSDDGFPRAEAPSFGGGSHYDGATGERMRDVPRGFLRSALHEVGHAFNQRHQDEPGQHGSGITEMNPTNTVARRLGTTGTFPDDAAISFNATVRRRLAHMPDPAVRPGAMNFQNFDTGPGSAPVVTVDALQLELHPGRDTIRMGEPLALEVVLTNTAPDSGPGLPVPERIDIDTDHLRLAVERPDGTVRHLKSPVQTDCCPTTPIGPLDGGDSRTTVAPVFWGQAGFAFEQPGRHTIIAHVTWNSGDVEIATRATTSVWVDYPVSARDNDVAAAFLEPCVGEAVVSGRWSDAALECVEPVLARHDKHPACVAMTQLDRTNRACDH